MSNYWRRRANVQTLAMRVPFKLVACPFRSQKIVLPSPTHVPGSMLAMTMLALAFRGRLQHLAGHQLLLSAWMDPADAPEGSGIQGRYACVRLC